MDQKQLVNGGALHDASVAELLATARTLTSMAFNRSRLGSTGLSREDLLDDVKLAQEAQNAAWAVQSVRLAQFAAIEEVPDGRSHDELDPRAASLGSDHGAHDRAARDQLDAHCATATEDQVTLHTTRLVRHAPGTFSDEFAVCEIAAALAWSDRQATNRVTDAVAAVTRLPRLLGHVAQGGLDARKLTAVSDVVCGAPPAVAYRVDAELIDAASRSGCAVEELSSTKLTRRARRVLAAAAPVEADAAAARRRAELVGVNVRPHHEPGLSVLEATLPTRDAMEVMGAVNQLARDLRQDTTTGKNLDECRVDALTDLLLRNVAIETTLVFRVPVDVTTPTGGSNRDSRRLLAMLRQIRDERSRRHPADRRCGAGLDALTPSGGPVADRQIADRHHGTTLAPPTPPTGPATADRQIADRHHGTALDPPTPPTGPATADRQIADRHHGTTLDPPTPATGPVAVQDGRSGTKSVAPSGRPLSDRRHDSDATGPPDQPPFGHQRDHRLAERSSPPMPFGIRRQGGGATPRLGAELMTAPITPWSDRAATSPASGMRDTVIEGLGIIPADTLETLSDHLGVRITRSLVDSRTGATIETSDATYRPGARLRRFVMDRDQHCRFPGCTRPARWCDLDHVVAWPSGATSAANLQTLCRHHHRAKHETAWRVSMTADGLCTWTSPSGREYLTNPAD